MSPASFVIPFYNDQNNFKEFFDKNYSIIKLNNVQNEIIFIDDTGNDEALKIVHEKFSDVIIISHKVNKGFSISINDGVARAKHEIAFLLNSDILISNEAIENTIHHFDDKQLFAVTLKSIYPDGRIREGAKSFFWKGGLPKIKHSPRHFPKPDKYGLVHSYYAVGGHCAVRKSMFLDLEGLDYKTFHPFYWEDTDLSIRAKKKGWKIIYEPLSIVQHPPENSSITNNFKRKYISEIKFKNRVFFALKNYPHYRIRVSFFLYLRFFQKLLKFDNAASAYKKSIGLINEFKKLK